MLQNVSGGESAKDQSGVHADAHVLNEGAHEVPRFLLPAPPQEEHHLACTHAEKEREREREKERERKRARARERETDRQGERERAGE